MHRNERYPNTIPATWPWWRWRCTFCAHASARETKSEPGGRRDYHLPDRSEALDQLKMLHSGNQIRLISNCSQELRIANKVYMVVRIDGVVSHWLYLSDPIQSLEIPIDEDFVKQFGTFSPSVLRQFFLGLKQFMVSNEDGQWENLAASRRTGRG